MDILHDTSYRTWLGIGNTFEDLIPAYVLNASLPDKEAAAGLCDRYFADEGSQQYPLDTPVATWLSAAYFAKHASELPWHRERKEWVELRIKEAADVYGITKDVEQIMTAIRATPTEKRASDDDSNWGWVRAGVRSYPMFDSKGVKLAASYFVEHREKYDAEKRKTVASNIMSKAAEYGVSVDQLPPPVLREAGYGIPRKDILMSEILERAHLAKDAEACIALANINELLMGRASDELAGSLDKLAEVITAFDEANGLTVHYNKRISMPADFLYTVSLKAASDSLDDAIELNQYMFSLSKLASLQPAIYADVLGDDFVAAVSTKEGSIDQSKLGDVLNTLPRPAKTALEDHLQALFN